MSTVYRRIGEEIARVEKLIGTGGASDANTTAIAGLSTRLDDLEEVLFDRISLESTGQLLTEAGGYISMETSLD